MLGAVLDWLDGAWRRGWYRTIRTAPDPLAVDWYPAESIGITVQNLTVIPIDVVVALWTREGELVGICSATASLEPNAERAVDIVTGRVHVTAIGTLCLSAGGGDYPRAAMVTKVEMEGHLPLRCAIMADVTPRMTRVPRWREAVGRFRNWRRYDR